MPDHASWSPNEVGSPSSSSARLLQTGSAVSGNAAVPNTGASTTSNSANSARHWRRTSARRWTRLNHSCAEITSRVPGAP